MAEDRWVAFFDGTEEREPRPLLGEAVAAAGPGVAGRVAVELGCGSGIETRVLLEQGWRVVAMDGSPEGVRRTVARAAELAGRLDAEVADLAEWTPPPADLIYAGLSLPFCAPGDFPRLWTRVRAALRPHAVLAAHLFGVHDDWAGEPRMTFHDRRAVDALLDGLEVIRLDEDERDGPAFSGPKHWHLFEIVARQPS